MSKDIRSFFSVVTKKSTPNVNPTKKRKPIVIDSSDDEIAFSPVEVKTKPIIKSKKRKLIDSDSEDERKKSKESKNDAKIQKVSASDIFGSAPIKQTKVEKKVVPDSNNETKKKTANRKLKTPSKPETELGIHDDPAFEQSLLDLDNDLLLDNVNMLDKTIEEALHNADVSMSSTFRKDGIPDRKRHSEDEDNGIDKDQERYEKKRHSAMLYQKYLHRSGPAHHGAKEYPKGKPSCLQGLCFLRTGVLDSLEGDEFQSLINDHGGRTVHSVSKKVNYIVAGIEPGPAKIEKAKSLNIPIISEDELLDLILLKSGMAAKYAKTDESGDSIEEKLNLSKEVVSVKATSPKKPREKKNRESENTKKENKYDDVKLEKAKQVETSIKQDVGKERTSLLSSNNKSKATQEEVINISKTSFYGKGKSSTDNREDIEEDKCKLTNEKSLSWADKYKPTNTKNIIGQQGDKSCVRKLLYWLTNWYENHSGKNKPKLVKPSPWSKSDDGAFYKCALLSGPPGVGKTTTATLVAQELGFDIIEFNASDTRSKKLLHEEVSQLLSTKSLAGFLKDGSAPSNKHVLLMDEVDGMAGNEDRGGMQELIQLIKNSHIPIICMCNDRNHSKVRSLANYCFDLRFSKPRVEQIRGAMMSVCFKENLKIKPEALSQIINGTGNDIRQTLNHLSMWTVNNKSLSVEEAQKEANAAQKDTILGPWEVIRKVFSEEEHKTMKIADKFRLFFYDYSIGPLFVQENYLHVLPHCSKDDILQRAAYTADSISRGDIVDKKMRGLNNWSLLEIQAIYASVLPGHYMEGSMKGQINFPGWLGKNSRKGKFKRLISELQAHMRISTSGSRKSMNLDYIYHLRNNIIKPLINEGTNGIEKAINVMHSYNLLREDLDSITEVSHWAKQKDPMTMVESKVKAAFTRAYNKDATKLPYSISSAAIKKKVSSVPLDDNPYDEEEIDSPPEDDDDIGKDAMIKAKKNPTKPKNTKEEGTSKTVKKAGGSGKGRGSKKTK